MTEREQHEKPEKKTFFSVWEVDPEVAEAEKGIIDDIDIELSFDRRHEELDDRKKLLDLQLVEGNMSLVDYEEAVSELEVQRDTLISEETARFVAPIEDVLNPINYEGEFRPGYEP